MKTNIFILLLLYICTCISCDHQSGRRGKGRPVTPRPPIGIKRSELSGSSIFEKYNSAVFMIFTTDGRNIHQGSGFFISENGLAVSNYHVFKGTSIGSEAIKLSNGKILPIKEIVGYNKTEDYILFRIEGRFNHIPISSRHPKVGEKVYAIGSPLGLENTFSSGEISQIRDGNYIQISCPIDHGSSGGVLLNQFGEAIGITTAKIDQSGANLNFAKDIHILPKQYIR